MAKDTTVQERLFDVEFDSAVNDGLVQELVPKQFKFSKEGDRITGRLMAVEECKGKEEGVYSRYIVNTDDGMKTIVCGAQVDAILSNGKMVGSLVRITFLGKEKLGSGRTMNKWDVRVKK